jgi:glucan endo-1,3-alpha-glucosidase
MDLDNYYIAGNGGKLFMAAASPWFYSHYSYKNWFYGGDDWLYPARWEQLVANRNKIDLVEVISWNDYGESHYIGVRTFSFLSLREVDCTDELLDFQPIEGAQPNSEAWVNGFDHLAWLDMTKYYADAYRTGTWPTITQDKLYLWARPHPASASAPSDPLGLPTGAGWVRIAFPCFIQHYILTQTCRRLTPSGQLSSPQRPAMSS